ncbi:hypothetical protein B0F90DRAFT_1669869 [Multifurca ochricompacta]|uniref:Uncharacterized protein n=1 Tax=Multifurca ochricompacta TaxID=376703 RepID=A0AAD4LZC8_9AGAM|nr:hypothetical protein B0F90DRAFT_1669869 [Multifurca ochricompacta]
MSILVGTKVLSILGRLTGRRWSRVLLLVDGIFVLLGGVTTGTVTTIQLLDRMANGHILPHWFNVMLPLMDNQRIAALFFTGLSLLLFRPHPSRPLRSRIFSLVMTFVVLTITWASNVAFACFYRIVRRRSRPAARNMRSTYGPVTSFILLFYSHVFAMDDDPVLRRRTFHMLARLCLSTLAALILRQASSTGTPVFFEEAFSTTVSEFTPLVRLALARSGSSAMEGGEKHKMGSDTCMSLASITGSILNCFVANDSHTLLANGS